MTGFKHGYRNTKVYSIVDCVIRRCHDINKDNYPSYGGRGITVCDEWRNDRAEFCRWLESEGFRDGLQVDRIDNDKGYSPENCRLLPSSFNGINKRGYGASGICGVYFKSDCTLRPYLATVRLYGKEYIIGRYSDIEIAKKNREFVALNLCDRVATICKENSGVEVCSLKNQFLQVLDELLNQVK